MVRALLKRLVLTLLPPQEAGYLRRELQRLGRNEDYFEVECRREFFRCAMKALSFNHIPGDYLEFGCYGAMTFRLAYEEAKKNWFPRKLWAFDSFQGLPPQTVSADAHPIWQPGTMATSIEAFRRLCSSSGMANSDYEIVPGFYEQSLSDPELLARMPRDICFVYIDCDLFSSTKTVLEFLLPRLKHGMIIALDDYFCWSATEPAGERRALHEAMDDHHDLRLVPYLTFGWHGQSFLVEKRPSGR